MFISDVNPSFIFGIDNVFMNKTPIERVTDELTRRGLTPADMARLLRVSAQRLNNWINRGLPARSAPEVADRMGWTVDYLLTGRDRAGNTDDGPPNRGKVPLISWVQAGAFAAVIDHLHPGQGEDWVDTCVPIHAHTYALRVRGDSMTSPSGTGTSFPHGTIIVVEPDAVGSLDQMVNQFVIVKRSLDDEATFKQLVRDGGQYYLKPLNPQYPILTLREDDTFCGVVREKIERFF